MAKTLAIVLGIVVILVGLLGFVANPIVGDSGMFMTNAATDVLYIILGLILVGVALWATAQSALWLKIVGVVYLLVAVLGFVMSSPLLGVFAVNMMTTWLHVVLGVVLLVVGFMGKGAMKSAPMPAAAPSMPPSNPPMGGSSM